MPVPPDGVSQREAEVLAALGEHLSNAQIANRLHISVRTVETHVSSLLRKLGAADRRVLAAAADRVSTASPAPPRPFSGLPATSTTFVGRAWDRDAVIAALADSRLVTMLGPGGMGKTRLAIAVVEAVAPAYPAGGAFVDLVPAGAGFVTRAVADALDVAERPAQPLGQAVLDRLGPGQALLVLDNCEHVVDEVSDLVGRVLAGCPRTTVLATSRERIGVSGERVVLVPPLPLGADAEHLFLDRARAADPDFAADPSVVSDLCAQLDGMPLAIELAAARAASLGADGLAAALEDRLRLLAGGRGPAGRHRSMRAVIGWSFDLLDSNERSMLRRLSVFVGDFDLDAALAVSPEARRSDVADLLGRLVDRSLVVRGQSAGPSRWRLLHTIRAFGQEQLAAAGEQAEVRRRYLDWAAAAAAGLESGIAAGLPGFDEVVDDLRAALAGTAAVADRTAHRLAGSLAHLAFARGFFQEARDAYRAAADRADDPAEARRDLRSAADVAVAVADGPAAFALLLDEAERARSAGTSDARAAALAYAVVVAVRYPAGFTDEAPPERRAALLREATVAMSSDDPHTAALLATARAWHQGGTDSIADLALSRDAVAAARKAGDPVLVLGALDALGTATANSGRMREAFRIAEERLRLVEGLPRHQPTAAAEIVDAFHAASTAAVGAGDLPAALAILGRARLQDPVGAHPYISAPRLVRVLALTGRFDEAVEHADAMWDAWRRDGSPPMPWMSTAVAAAALVHGLRGDERYELWRSRALQIAGSEQATDSPDLMACMAFVEARVAVHTGLLDSGAVLVARTAAPFPEPWWACYARAAGAELAVVAGRPDAAGSVALAEPAAAENDWAAVCLARARGRHDGDVGALRAAAEDWERLGARFERACTLMLLPDRAGEGRAELNALRCPLPAEPAPAADASPTSTGASSPTV